ncbi:A/G-specific adenine glycosylase [Limnobacter sp.]|uniref:A/G-specific adenine glycosylase n=1 Tax=Limnobacter sp. TaxID=2003368 RepID=UPI003517D577
MNAVYSLQGDAFAQVLVRWQAAHGRQHLPWQHTGDAYKVWLSEVMLQQTQVSTVLAYYARFLSAFPTVHHLAAASEQDVMQLWAGLGYYSRARNLHACAKQVVERFGGQFPSTVAELESLPGIGRSTAGAIASLAYGVQAPILDGNVKRVFCRYYAVQGHPDQSQIQKALWVQAHSNVPADAPGQYNQALMDLGATLCTPKNPNCKQCPLMQSCQALRMGMVGQLPTPKPKKPRPNLYYLAVLLRAPGGALGLQLQTEKGVWHSLWTPPLLPCDSQVNEACLADLCGRWANTYALPTPLQLALRRQAGALQSQPWMVHELTHRKMHFKVVVLDVPEELKQGLQKAGLELALLETKPVPKVVHKLLAHAQAVLLADGAVPQQNTLDLG